MNKLFIPILLILTGCTTPYQRYSNSIFSTQTGFSDYQIAQDAFSVSFRANTVTDKSQTTIFALQRAAEITREHHFRYFTVDYISDQTQLKTFRYSDGDGNTTTELCQYPGITLHIKCYKDVAPQGAYDANYFFIPRISES